MIKRKAIIDVRQTRAAALILILLASTAAAAQAPAPTEAMNAGVAVLRMLGGLVFVIGLFFAALWLARNWQKLGLQRGRQLKLRVLESRALGPRQAIHVVRYENKNLLVAASPAGIVLLKDLGESELQEEAAAPAQTMNFAQLLTQALSGK